MSTSKSEQSNITQFRQKLKQIYSPHIVLLTIYFGVSGALAMIVAFSAQIRSDFIDMVLGNGKSTQVILLLLLNIIIVYGIHYGLPMILNFLEKILSHRISCETESAIGKRKSALLWFYYEDPEVNNDLELLKDAPDQAWVYFKTNMGIVSVLISTIGMFFLIGKMGICSVVMLFFLFIPVTFFSVQAASAYYDTWQRTAQLRRYCDYQRDVLMDKEYATERILFGFSPFFMKQWENDYKQVRSLSIQEELKGSRRMQVGGIIFCLYIVFLFVIIVNKLEAGQITVGYAVSLISIFPTLMNSMIVTLSNEINQMKRAKSAINTLVKFETLECEEGYFDLPEKGVDFKEIEFKQVSFKYPKTTKWVLKNVNMCFMKGKHYAIVGENGAGKSTLIKLLLGLYKVTEGEILVDGQNINDIPRTKMLGLITALFQDFQHYYTNVFENIGMGDINNIQDMSRIAECAEKANFHKRIEAMPDGYKTILGTMHQGGIELSGGEWQKLAISRLIMSPSPIKILDEPTAAMDPIFEYELYQDFNKIMKKKTTVTISHRFASCKNADYIYVLEQGSVSEQGTHEQLIADKQMYYKMYMVQKEMYQ